MLRLVIFCFIAFLVGYVVARLNNKTKPEPKPNEDLESWREKHK